MCGTRNGKVNSQDNGLVVFPRTKHRTGVSASQADNADSRYGILDSGLEVLSTVGL